MQPSASAARVAELDGAAVQHRQRARQAEADRADLRVRRRAERVLQPQKIFVCGQELRVDLEADDGLEGHGHVATQDGTER